MHREQVMGHGYMGSVAYGTRYAVSWVSYWSL